MKHDDEPLNDLESSLKEGYLSAEVPEVKDDWRSALMAEIGTTEQVRPAQLEPLMFVWRYAAAAASLAVAAVGYAAFSGLHHTDWVYLDFAWNAEFINLLL